MIKWAKEIGADSINFKSLSMGSYTTDDMKKNIIFYYLKIKIYEENKQIILNQLALSPTTRVLFIGMEILGYAA